MLLLPLISLSLCAATPAHDAVPRLDFNRRAIERHLPLFWRADANHDNALSPDELAVLWTDVPARQSDYVDAKGNFTPKFEAAYALLSKPYECPGKDKAHCELLQQELSQGRPTLVENDFSKSPAEQKLAAHMVKVAGLIEKLFQRQNGVFGWESKLPKGDTLAAAVFLRNQSPWCVAPLTEKNEACTAIVPRPKQLSGLYPADLQANKDFCATLNAAANATELTDHFTVVTGSKDALTTVPYPKAWAEMAQVAKELEAAAADLPADEAALKAYLLADAKAFRTNEWTPADEAWVAMGIDNSKYYLRVAPDEVYYEPCALKAGFALQFARINKDSVEWQKKLDPVKGEMEKTLAALAGSPYVAREVKFKLPDFIEVVLNAADQRNPHGATIGQSLPNWGPVAKSGGRTSAMVNLYTDEDSLNQMVEQTSSVFCKATEAKVAKDPKAGLMSVVLHEAAHNLGPAQSYQVNGRGEEEIFGGPLASTLEELKAQTSALFFADWLADKKVISADDALKSHVFDLTWALGHISRGMYDSEGKPKNYSQLASIQMGFFRKTGALTWKPDELAANGKDKGCLEADLVKLKSSVAELEKTVVSVKGRGDRAGAEKLKADFVDANDDWAKLRALVTERWLRAPKASFVYSVKY